VGISLFFDFVKNLFKKLKYAIIRSMILVTNILPYAQIILSVILVASILLQQSAAGLGGALGGSDTGSFHHTRRGFEKFLFYLSLVCGILFALLSLLSIILKANS
jgi:protein translocase SecG subunit